MGIPVIEQAKIQAQVLVPLELTRTQTIMQGASHCDSRYARQKEKR